MLNFINPFAVSLKVTLDFVFHSASVFACIDLWRTISANLLGLLAVLSSIPLQRRNILSSCSVAKIGFSWAAVLGFLILHYFTLVFMHIHPETMNAPVPLTLCRRKGQAPSFVWLRSFLKQQCLLGPDLIPFYDCEQLILSGLFVGRCPCRAVNEGSTTRIKTVTLCSFSSLWDRV